MENHVFKFILRESCTLFSVSNSELYTNETNLPPKSPNLQSSLFQVVSLLTKHFRVIAKGQYFHTERNQNDNDSLLEILHGNLHEKHQKVLTWFIGALMRLSHYSHQSRNSKRASIGNPDSNWCSKNKYTDSNSAIGIIHSSEIETYYW